MSGSDFIFEWVDGGYEVEGLEGWRDPDIVIPSEHGGRPVVGIAGNAFKYHHEMESVVIPDTVERIKERAFFGCDGLKDVSGMGGVRRIDAEAFSCCRGLTRMTVPACCAEIGPDAFSKCVRLAEVKNLSALDIRPGTPGHPGPEGLFHGCNVCRDEEGTGTFLTTEDGFRWYLCDAADGTRRCLLTGYEGDEKDIVLPEAFGGLPYDIFGSVFFGRSDLESVSLPPCVRYIGPDAFMGCGSLRNARVRSLSDWLGIRFENGWSNPLFCFGGTLWTGDVPVEDFALPSGTEDIPDFAFAGAGFERVAIPDGVTRIGRGAFEGCESLVGVTLPKSLLTIEDDAFRGCDRMLEIVNLSRLRIIPGDIGYGRVAECAKAVKSSEREKGRFFRDGGGFGFYDSGEALYLTGYSGGRTSIALPAVRGRTYEVCDDALAGRRVTDVSVPSWVSSLGIGALSYCEYLRHVSLGDGVAYIGEAAFEGCPALEEVETGRGLLMIGPWAFRDCEGLRNVRLREGLRYIGRGAFDGCGSLSGIVVPGSVEHIGRGAFRTSDGDGNLHAVDVFLLGDPRDIRPGPEEWREPSDPDCDYVVGYEAPMTVYVYSAEKPDRHGMFWHYDGAGNPVKWL